MVSLGSVRIRVRYRVRVRVVLIFNCLHYISYIDIRWMALWELRHSELVLEFLHSDLGPQRNVNLQLPLISVSCTTSHPPVSQ